VAGRHTKLTPELQRDIVAFITSGSFDYIAAEAVGISRATFYRWYNAGSKAASQYAPFRTAVDTARARARVVAENRVFKEKPDVWLRLGPGRDRPGRPGWTSPARPWTDDIDDEALAAAAKKLAARLGIDEQELLRLARDMARQARRIEHLTNDPDLFLETHDE
jgi:hypothetical protein